MTALGATVMVPRSWRDKEFPIRKKGDFMNRKQKGIGWVFVIVVALLMVFIGINAVESRDDWGYILIIGSVAGVGVWAFISAGSKHSEHD